MIRRRDLHAVAANMAPGPNAKWLFGQGNDGTWPKYSRNNEGKEENGHTTRILPGTAWHTGIA